MRIIPFPSQLKRAEPKVQDWSQQEIADFYRAHRLLAENGVMIGIDRGVSDIGEPWMVFFDIASQDVFMHVARIDDVCHLICDTLGLKLSAANIEALITSFENSVRNQLSIRAEHNAKVVLHPAARIIMSISAVFLLFKLSNGEAQAKGLMDKGPASPAEGSTARATDKASASMARAQSAFSRAFDNMEAPASAAVVASIILAGELSALYTENTQKTATAARPLVDIDPITEVKLALQVETERKTVAPEAHDLDTQEQNTTVAVVAEERSPSQKADGPVEVSTSKDDSSGKDIVLAQQVFAIKNVPQDVSLAVKLDLSQKGGASEPAQTAAPRAHEQAAEAANSADAKRAMDDFLKKTNAAPVDSKVVSDNKVVIELGTVTAVNVPTFDGKVGFFMKTNLDLAKMYALVEHFKNEMGQHDFDYASGQVLIEEKNVSKLSAKDVGIWTNVLNDGSSWSVVGHASLIDDLVHLIG